MIRFTSMGCALAVLALATACAEESPSINSDGAHTTKAASTASNTTTTATTADDDRCYVAWSHYTGWEPAGYIQDSGIADEVGQRHDVDLRFTLINDYIESINQYTAGSFDGVTSTTMDALTIPAVGGRTTEVLVVGDFSNGNDAILVRTGGDFEVADLAGSEVRLVELSVSHYLLARALDENGLSEQDLTVINTSDADIGSLIATGEDGSAFVTWNPIVMNALTSTPGVKSIFDSSQIPGEIVDSIVVDANASDSCKRAITEAWYTAMDHMSPGSDQRDDMIEFLAEQAGGTVGEFEAQLATTSMFYQAGEAVTFVNSNELKDTMEQVRNFSFDKGLYGENAANADFVGIQFADGSVLGDESNVQLIFTNQYMQLAADGELAN